MVYIMDNRLYMVYYLLSRVAAICAQLNLSDELFDRIEKVMVEVNCEYNNFSNLV